MDHLFTRGDADAGVVHEFKGAGSEDVKFCFFGFRGVFLTRYGCGFELIEKVFVMPGCGGIEFNGRGSCFAMQGFFR